MLVYDLLASPDCLPDLLQGGLRTKGLDEAFLLSSFKLQNKVPAQLYSISNPTDSSKYLDLSVQAKLNKGEISNTLLLFRRKTPSASYLSFCLFISLSHIHSLMLSPMLSFSHAFSPSLSLSRSLSFSVFFCLISLLSLTNSVLPPSLSKPVIPLPQSLCVT